MQYILGYMLRGSSSLSERDIVLTVFDGVTNYALTVDGHVLTTIN